MQVGQGVVERRGPGQEDVDHRNVAKAVARVERGRMANAVVRRDARRFAPMDERAD